MKSRIIAILALLWRFITWIWSILILGVVAGVLGNIVYTYFTTGRITFADPRTLTILYVVRSHFYLVLFAVTTCLVITLSAFLAHNSQKNISLFRVDDQHPILILRTQKQNRQRLIEKVFAFWIKGVLEQSLHGAALIVLGLHNQPNAVSNSWRLLLQEDNVPARSLPFGTSIVEVYDNAGGELLILGEPGSGKTTLLLELTRELLERARRDSAYQIPVILNLSSWTIKRQPLADWIIEELSNKYQVPKRVGHSWIENDQLQLLLDGLDEVKPNYRTMCIKAINLYRGNHGLVPFVVCSRKAEYFAQEKRALLRSAVSIQPLTTKQITEYLLSAGDQLKAVQVAISKNSELMELAMNPLMLSLLTLAYRGASVKDIFRDGSPKKLQRQKKLQQQIFKAYMQRMLQRQSTKSRYSSKQMIRRLSWLAWQMELHNQTEFYIERMQLDWLSEPYWNRLPFRDRLLSIIVGLATGLTNGLVSGLVIALIGTQYYGLQNGLLTGLAGGLLIGIVLVVIIYKDTPHEWSIWNEFSTPVTLNEKYPPKELYNDMAFKLTLGMVGGLLCGLISGLFCGLISILDNGLTYGLINGLVCFLIIGSISSVIFEGGTINSAEIKPAEILTWSWSRVRQRMIVIPLAVLAKIITRELFERDEEGNITISLREIVHKQGEVINNVRLWINKQTKISKYLYISAIVGVIIFLIILIYIFLIPIISIGIALILFSGLSNNTVDEHILITPNQGIRRSARNSIIVGLITTIILGLTFSLINVLIRGETDGLLKTLMVGLTIGLPIGGIVALLNGGMACLKHVVLRLLLSTTGYVPLNYPNFLNYATECIILRKVGGGYIFVHRLLLEYLANENSTLK